MREHMNRRQVAALVAGLTAGFSARAADYPDRAIKFIVPASAGGGADFVGRVIGPVLTQKLGQSIIIDNRAGASGTIGADITAKSPPDGYTFLLAQSTSVAIAPHLYQKLPYDTLKDFVPVTQLVSAPNLLVVNASLPVKTVKELIEYAKANKDGVNFGSAGAGAPSHLAGEMFNKAAGVKMTHVPYKGAGPALNAALSGEVQVFFSPIQAVTAQVKAGKLRAIAITSAKHSPAAPGIPTIAESGLPGYDIDSWFGLLAPAKTPTAIVQKIYQECRAALAMPDVKDRFLQEGCVPVGSDPATFTKFIQSEYTRFAKVVKDTGVKLD